MTRGGSSHGSSVKLLSSHVLTRALQINPYTFRCKPADVINFAVHKIELDTSAKLETRPICSWLARGLGKSKLLHNVEAQLALSRLEKDSRYICLPLSLRLTLQTLREKHIILLQSIQNCSLSTRSIRYHLLLFHSLSYQCAQRRRLSETIFIYHSHV